MKRLYTLLYSVFLFASASFAQNGTWTWISGDSAMNAAGLFGTEGTASVNNHPPGVYDALEWKDKQGNFWIYGGTDTTTTTDLWEFNPTTLQWTWVKGNGLPNQPMHGTKGVANAANTPGQRSNGVPTWVDTSGALWLFGGVGHGDDIWKFDTGTKDWTWVAGDTTPNVISHHGTLGTPGPLVTPGNRYLTCSTWTDSLNNLWLFGGWAVDDSSNGGGFSDLMKFNISTKQWTWVDGSALRNPDGLYGSKGVSNSTNEPMGRFPYTAWKDAQGNFWMFGGLGWTNSILANLNDVWEYNTSSGDWTWEAGTDSLNDTGYFNTSCVFDTLNNPASRLFQRSSVTDNCGRFWLFGGETGLFSPSGSLNDLWVFDPQQVKWSLARGTDPSTQLSGNYGAKGISSLSNLPIARSGALVWWGNDNKFYLFGGADNSSNVYADMWVFDPDTNCIPSCNAVSVPPPVASFQSSVTTLCAGDCISFTNLSTNATSWEWTFNGAADSTSSAQTPTNICYPHSGTYNVTLIAYNSGGSNSSTLTGYIDVQPAPPAPIIKQSGLVLHFTPDTSYASYQWYNDTTLIPLATDTFIVIDSGGYYNVQVIGKDGCKNASVDNIILSIQNYSSVNSITLYPNPVDDKLRINYAQAGGELEIEIYNTFGQLLYQSKDQHEIDVARFAAGVYFVHLKTKNDSVIKRFVKD